MTTAGHHLGRGIRDAAVTSADGPAFRNRVLELLHQQAPFDAACLATTEPSSMLPTSLTTIGYEGADVYAAVLDIEYGPHPEPGRFETLRGRRFPVRTHHEATGGRTRSSRFFADVLAPQGLDHEVRMIFRGKGRSTWGACTLARQGQDFTDDEVASLASATSCVAEGLRSTLFRDGLAVAHSSTDGPAVLVVGPHGEISLCSPAARDYLERLAWGPADRPIPSLPAVVIATWLRRSGRLSGAWRWPTRDGGWVLVRAGLVPDGGSGGITVTFEPAPVGALAPVLAAAHHLTPREREVLSLLLSDRSREEIAHALCLSPYTVQDHLRSIYAKTGTSGRRGLVSLLVHEDCQPRWGTDLGADGWFARPGVS